MNDAMFLLLLSLGAAILWTGIAVLYIVPQKQRAKKWNMQYDPRGTIAKFAVVGVMGQVLYWNLAIGLLRYSSYSRYSAANSNAKAVYNIVCSYQIDHPDCKVQTMAGCARREGSDDSLESYMNRYLDEKFYFAVVIGKNGKPEAAYWSKKPLNVNTLHGTTPEEVRSIILNPFADDKKIVGEYPSQEMR
jgi:hypothetical protein